MPLIGSVENGQIVLDQPNGSLPEGPMVRIEVIEEEPTAEIDRRFRDIAGKAKGLPADASSNLDHYLYGDGTSSEAVR